LGSIFIRTKFYSGLQITATNALWKQITGCFSGLILVEYITVYGWCCIFPCLYYDCI